MGKSYFVLNTFNSTASLGLVVKGAAPVGTSNAGDPVFNFIRPTTSPYVVDKFDSRFQGQLGLRYSF